jgi:hypothetical protein
MTEHVEHFLNFGLYPFLAMVATIALFSIALDLERIRKKK